MSDLEHKAIERIKYAAEISAHYYNAPLYVTYSGGKDSEVELELAKRSGVDFEVYHNHTTVDAPETVRHVRDTFHTSWSWMEYFARLIHHAIRDYRQACGT